MSNHTIDTGGDHWTKDGAFFIHSGEKYGVIPDGQTVSLGPVAKAGQPSPDAKEAVQKVKDGELHRGRVFAQKNGGKKTTGRPMLDLPIEMIRNLYSEGASVAQITDQLRAKHIKVSRRTVYNVIAGQGVLV